MEAQSRVAAESNEQQDQLDANVDGQDKKSMFHSVKDKVKHLNAKVRKNIKARQGHGETHEEEDEEDEEEQDEEEEQYRTPRKSDGNEGHAAKPLVGLDTHGMQDKPHSKEEIREETMMAKEDPTENLSPYKETEQAKGGILETETDVGTPSMTQRAEEIVTEDTETTPQDKVSEVGEGNELASNTNPPNVTEKVESGASQTDSGFMSKAAGLAQGMKGVFAGKQSSNDNVEDNEGPQQQQSEVGGVGHAKENLVEIGSGPYSAEKQEEESQILAGKAQDKDCEDGEVNELASNTKPPNSTEEVKSGTPETGYGAMRKASGLAQGLKGVFAGNESSKDNVKDNDTVLQEDYKEKDDEGLQQQKSETEAKAGQSYVEKLYAAKAAIGTKLGYGGQTNQENNATRESKSCDPIQVPRSGTGTEAMEGAKESKKSPVVSKLSPGEDDKALSKVITEAVSSVKGTIVGGFYGSKEKSPTTIDTTMGASQSTPRSPSSNVSGGKGIVDRVTGVVGSFVGRKQGEDSAISPSTPKQESNPVVQIEKQMAELRVQPDQPTGKSELQNEESTLMEH